MIKEKGFTLIELMIVVAIIGILAAIAIPQFGEYRTKAYNSAAQTDLKAFQLAAEDFYNDYGTYPNAISASTGSINLTDGTNTTTAAVVTSDDVYIRSSAGTGNLTYAASAQHNSGNKKYTGDSDGGSLTSATASIGTAASITAPTAP